MLHRTVSLSGPSTSLGTIYLAQLSTYEQNWLVDMNLRRTANPAAPTQFQIQGYNIYNGTFSGAIPITAPTTTPASTPVVDDEYLEEEARQWANDVLNAVTQWGDSGVGPYFSVIMGRPGYIGAPDGIIGLNGNCANINYQQNPDRWDCQWQSGESGWMSEQSNCVADTGSASWVMCPLVRVGVNGGTFTNQTGHYIAESDSAATYVGMGFPWWYPGWMPNTPNGTYGSAGPIAAFFSLNGQRQYTGTPGTGL